MRTTRLGAISAPIIAACALAVGAVPASATEPPPEFQANKLGSTRGVGLGSNEVFKLNPLTITCLKSTSSGAVETLSSESLKKVVVKYISCKTFNTIPVSISPASLEFSANGTVRIEEPITVAIATFKCSVTIAAQTTPSPLVIYSDIAEYGKPLFPNGQQKIAMNTKIAGLSYTASNWPCAGPTKEEQPEERTGEEGKFSGEMKDELVGGNLTWVP